jgi:Regulatory CLIP domain of proteinases
MGESVKMKTTRQSIPVFVLMLSALVVCQSLDDIENTVIGTECPIPNQSKTRGVCLQRQSCEPYNDLFNVTDLTVERLSFIINLDCGFDFGLWKTLVCCPQPGNTYK